MNKVTNFDAKKAFVNFMTPFGISSIYINEYWDYYIKEYNLENQWNDFLEKFIDEKFTYETFKNEWYKIFYSVLNYICSFYNDNKISEKCEYLFQLETQEIKTINYYDISDGTYIDVNINNCFDLAMIFCNKDDEYISIYDNINNITSFNIFKNQRALKISIINNLPWNIINKMYTINNKILIEDLYQTKNTPLELLNNTCELIGKTEKDSLIYKISNTEQLGFILNNYETYHINTLTVKTIKMFGNDCKCLITRDKDNRIYNFDLYYLDKQLNTSIYPFALKLALGEELNDKDLTFGYEDEIFFKFDKSEIV